MRRIVAISLVALLMTATTVLAADETAKALTPAAVTFTSNEPAPRRPAILPALYASTVALQGYDVYSTLSVLNRGGIEQNPMMKTVVRNPAAFVALKSGITIASIMATEHMWKHHNRTAAIVTMVAANGLMAIVAAHNARVLGQVR